eukprot:1145190-Pelagomonas_calceolata.AAC.1
MHMHQDEVRLAETEIAALKENTHQYHIHTHLNDASFSICGGPIKYRSSTAVAQHPPKQLYGHDAKDDKVEGHKDDDVQQHRQAGDDGPHQVLHVNETSRCRRRAQGLGRKALQS